MFCVQKRIHSKGESKQARKDAYRLNNLQKNHQMFYYLQLLLGEKPYSCKYCGRLFAQLSNKQKHELLHEGIKPFACSICSAAFTQQGNLKKHLLIHNNSNKMLNCKFCKKMYIKKRNLLHHQEECESLHSLFNNLGSESSNDEQHNKTKKVRM